MLDLLTYFTNKAKQEVGLTTAQGVSALRDIVAARCLRISDSSNSSRSSDEDAYSENTHSTTTSLSSYLPSAFSFPLTSFPAPGPSVEVGEDGVIHYSEQPRPNGLCATPTAYLSFLMNGGQPPTHETDVAEPNTSEPSVKIIDTTMKVIPVSYIVPYIFVHIPPVHLYTVPPPKKKQNKIRFCFVNIHRMQRRKIRCSHQNSNTSHDLERVHEHLPCTLLQKRQRLNLLVDLRQSPIYRS